MKCLIICCSIFISSFALAQEIETRNNQFYNNIFDSKYMQKPPIFMGSKDSLQRFYYNHFSAFNTIIEKAVANGDTAKYIRVYFNFLIDNNGAVYNGKFTKVASTRYASGDNAKTVKYFFEDKILLNEAVKHMIEKMPYWRPGLENGVRVTAAVDDYLQFWVGINPPPAY